ncbi:hypothetical protein MA16_Dca005935 [Dendrobium catenatum]|uniref:Uncharacterized protein n=1 Tax=Dendrobium catenatum TaxID=906689 RepID=A0A2I0WJP9_9ASPA|nr:hypothetical protein MA16_Dca005935 [Dendrobium catenatum]
MRSLPPAKDLKSNINERVEEATRAISSPPAKQRNRTAMTKREDERRTLDPSHLCFQVPTEQKNSENHFK